jgi:hypothetical protein
VFLRVRSQTIKPKEQKKKDENPGRALLTSKAPSGTSFGTAGLPSPTSASYLGDASDH